MKDTITKHYPNLTGIERFQLALRATAEGNDEERERLVKTCPKKDYRMNDADFLDRIEAAETLTIAFALDLAERHGRLQLVAVFVDYIPHILDNISYQAYLSMDSCYEEGFKQGWQAAGRKGKLPAKNEKKYNSEKIVEEISLKKKRHFQTLIKIRKELQGQVKAMWEAFSEVCQENMGLKPEIPLAAFFPPALKWLEDDWAEDIVADEDMKNKSLDLMREYWQKRVGELAR